MLQVNKSVRCVDVIVDSPWLGDWSLSCMSDFAGNSAKLALEGIRNSRLRDHYIEITQKTADDIYKDSKNAELLSPCQHIDVWRGAALKASKLRNVWMEKTRERMSPTALAFSKLIKSKAPTFSELVAKYTTRMYDNSQELDFRYLNDSYKIRVFQSIVKSSGRTNVRINIMSKVLCYIGIISLLLTFGFIFYGIISSKNHAFCIVRCFVTFQTGLAGSYIGSRIGSQAAGYLYLRHVYVFIMTIFGGLCVGVTTALIGDIFISYVNTKIYPGTSDQFSVSMIG